MAQLYDLGQIFQSNGGRVVTVVKIISQDSTELFTIADLNHEIKMVVRARKAHQLKYLNPGSTIRIVDPELDQEGRKIVIGKKTHLFPATPLQGMDSKEVTLRDLFESDARTIVRSKITLKVVKVDQTSVETTYGTAIVKKCTVKVNL